MGWGPKTIMREGKLLWDSMSQGLLSSTLCRDGLHPGATNNRKPDLLRTVSCELFVTARARRELTRHLHSESDGKQDSFLANLDFT